MLGQQACSRVSLCFVESVPDAAQQPVERTKCMAVDEKDYYRILGVKEDADEKEIHQAYRKLALKHHPDVNPGDKAAEERFKDINEANEVLSDPEKRQKYDEMRRYRQQYGRWPGEGRQPAGAAGRADTFRGGNYEYRTVNEEDLQDL